MLEAKKIIKLLALILCLLLTIQSELIPLVIGNKKLAKITLKIPPFCGKGFDFNDQIFGCIKSCKNPVFQFCQSIVPVSNQTNSCGLLKNGSWVNLTSECQACGFNNTQYVGILDKPCLPDGNPVRPPCNDDTKCKFEEFCDNNKCVDKCSIVICTTDYHCQYGTCKKNTPPPPPCVRLCQEGYRCQNNICVLDIPIPKPCLLYCSTGYQCINGYCVLQSLLP